MAVSLRKGAAGRGRIKSSKQVHAAQPSREVTTSLYECRLDLEHMDKRRRRNGDEDVAKPVRKSSRIRENANKRGGSEAKVQPELPRKRLGVKKNLESNQQPPAQTKQLKRPRRPESKGEKQSKSSPSNTGPQKNATQQDRAEKGYTSTRAPKRPKHAKATPRSELSYEKRDFIENWLRESCWSQREPTDNKNLLREASDNAPSSSADILPSPTYTGMMYATENTPTTLRCTDYRNAMAFRNIYIERDELPLTRVMRRATKMISRRRTSPEIDDATAQELRAAALKVRNKGEDKIVQQLAPLIIPSMSKEIEEKLEQAGNRLWFNSVPVPLHQSELSDPPLPRPKPDLAFGYPEIAFTRGQRGAINCLFDDQSGNSYAIPGGELHFPFLVVEFKSQAKRGTHYFATNQAASSGAIASNGYFELIQRSLGADKFDFDQPQFFSVTMDHEYVRINVHWVDIEPEDGEKSFHVDNIMKHFLDDANGVREIRRAVKNILEYGATKRLPHIRDALDLYRQKLIREGKARNIEADHESVSGIERQAGQRKRRRRATLSTDEQEEN